MRKPCKLGSFTAIAILSRLGGAMPSGRKLAPRLPPMDVFRPPYEDDSRLSIDVFVRSLK